MIAHMMLALLVIATSSPYVAVTQRSTIPPQVISEAADCINDAIRSVLYEDVYTPEIGGGWQIIVPLRGQVNPDRSAQTLPPVADADFVLSVFAVSNEAELPSDLEPFSDFAVVASNGIVWYARSSGYFWLLPSTTARDCFRRVTNGRSVIG